MKLPFKKLAAPIFALSLAGAGLAYAATETPTQDTVEPRSDELTSPAPDLELETGPAESPEAPEVSDDAGDDEGAEPETGDHHGVQRSTEDCPEGFSGNHGQFVSGTEDQPRNEAAHSDCGKPVHAAEPSAGPDEKQGDNHQGENEGDDEGHSSGQRGQSGEHHSGEHGQDGDESD
jgi:hypothetical protein